MGCTLCIQECHGSAPRRAQRWWPYPALMGSSHKQVYVIAASGIAQEGSQDIIAASSSESRTTASDHAFTMTRFHKHLLWVCRGTRRGHRHVPW